MTLTILSTQSEAIKKYVKEGSRLLDFGSGLGRFPIYANKINKTYAVEPITYKSNFAVKKGIEVKKSINNSKGFLSFFYHKIFCLNI